MRRIVQTLDEKSRSKSNRNSSQRAGDSLIRGSNVTSNAGARRDLNVSTVTKGSSSISQGKKKLFSNSFFNADRTSASQNSRVSPKGRYSSTGTSVKLASHLATSALILDLIKEEDNPEQPQVTNEYGDLERGEAEAFTERKKFGNSTITESQLHHTNPLVSPVIKGPESKMRKSMFRYGIEDGLGEEELEYPDEKDRANQRPRIPAAAGERILGVFNNYR